MNNKVAFILGLAVGTALGVGVSWKALKTHYKRIADEEIESVKEYLRERLNEPQQSEPSQGDTETSDKEDPEELARQKIEYSNIANKYNKTGAATVEQTKPYTISPEEFGSRDNYETVTLSYYADGVLAYYSTDEVIEDVGSAVGAFSLNMFGEYEQDTVFIRNEATKTDYEILRDPSTYKDLYVTSPDEE